ncbi:MAG: DUF3080 family protein [Deltaproteobacteria bacterium]|jgi:hypothetical protein|nr:DUF3080 family protein [Deltaproteobacteria bacterium]MBW2496463.1 DUF3080 family protein [Deltaproteobacteria bacterium]
MRVAAAFVASLMLGCGPVSVADGLASYRQRVEQSLGLQGAAAAAPASVPRLPRRRERRIEVTDQRLGPFEFLAILGCPLSEVIAARNSALGRVLEPTRRLAHELEVMAAARDCMPTLSPERAARLGDLIEAKEADLGAHVWNAVWLDDDLERFLGAGPRALIGGGDPTDAAWQIQRAAEAIEGIASGDLIDSPTLESGFAGLRDDPALGRVLRDLDSARRELGRVASLVAPLDATRCDRGNRRLTQDFREGYLPIQAKLAPVDRRGRELLGSLDQLYRVSATAVDVPVAMRRFSAEVLDVEAEKGLWQGYRRSVARHAAAWNAMLDVCGLLPEARG